MTHKARAPEGRAGVLGALGVLVLGVFVMQASACSRSSSADRDAGDATAPDLSRIGSCERITAMSVCSEYTGQSLANDEVRIKESCVKLGGTFAFGECPSLTVLGSCRLALTSESRKHYSTGGVAYDAAGAQKNCETGLGGKWEPVR